MTVMTLDRSKLELLACYEGSLAVLLQVRVFTEGETGQRNPIQIRYSVASQSQIETIIFQGSSKEVNVVGEH